MASKENGAIIYLERIIHRINNSRNRLREMEQIVEDYHRDERDRRTKDADWWMRDEDETKIEDIDMYIKSIQIKEVDGDTCLSIQIYHKTDPDNYYDLYLDDADIFILYRAKEILRQPYYTKSTHTENWIVQEIDTTLKNRRTQNVQRSGITETKAPSLRF